jgi:hypothetical protein
MLSMPPPPPPPPPLLRYASLLLLLLLSGGDAGGVCAHVHMQAPATRGSSESGACTHTHARGGLSARVQARVGSLPLLMLMVTDVGCM